MRRELVAAIADGRLESGGALPPQDQLAEQFGVSRSVVREALRLLEASGAVVVRPGRGAMVAASPSAAVKAEWAGWLLAHREDVIEVLEVRTAIERVAAGKAAVKRHRQSLTALRGNVRQLRSAAGRGDVERVVSLDIEFHHLVAVASGSDLLVRLVDELAGVVRGSRLAAFSIPSRAERSAREHAAVVEAIRRGDSAAADAAIAAHLGAVMAAVDSVKKG